MTFQRCLQDLIKYFDEAYLLKYLTAFYKKIPIADVWHRLKYFTYNFNILAFFVKHSIKF